MTYKSKFTGEEIDSLLTEIQQLKNRVEQLEDIIEQIVENKQDETVF